MASSKLLSLPPELRDIIYRLALLEDGPIFLKEPQAFQQPGLLLTNSQIRNEAICLYYAENLFVTSVWSYDASPVRRLHNLQRTHVTASAARSSIKCHIQKRGVPNWENLLKWLQSFYKGDAPGYRHSPAKPYFNHIEAESQVLFTMFRLVAKAALNDSDWKFTKELLEAHHDLLIYHDPLWV